MYNSLKKQHAIVKNTNVNIVVNLSNRRLSIIETAVLNKGLNFCITNNRPKNNCKMIDSEIDKFIRTIQIKNMFKDKEESKIEKFTSNPDWQIPKIYRNLAVDSFGIFLKNNIKHIINKNKTKQNISKDERLALNKLGQDKNILINKADKGGSIVVMNTEDYKLKMLNMLADTNTYTITNNINLDEAKDEVDKLFLYMFNNNYISKRQYKYFVRNKPKLPILYGLGKIHKVNCPLRPICSQINSPTYTLSKFLDYLLTTAEKSIPNLLQDTTKFLQYVKKIPPASDITVLFTIDVTSLYTVLPHDMCIKYVCEMYEDTLKNWQLYTPELKPVPTFVIARILKIILSQTYFKFDEHVYIQKLGITMGSSCSVKVANITLHKHLNNIVKNYTGTVPNVMLRLIDDIFGTFEGPTSELLDFVAYLNNNHNTIKFTLEHSKTEVAFLDTLVYIEGKNITTKLYKKPTDNKQYLHYNSEHPQHMKKSIPYAQALRYRRIIENNDIYNSEIIKLASNFTARQYPISTVQAALDKVQLFKRDDLIRYKPKIEQDWNYTAFVLTFNNALVNKRDNNIYKLITNSWKDLITIAPELTTLKPPKIVFKKCQTITNLLVSTVFPPARWSKPPANTNIHTVDNSGIIPYSSPTFYSTKCAGKRCETCRQLTECGHFYSTTYSTRYPLTANMNCAVKNVVYLITCALCRLQYVGETGMCVRDRMTAHRSCVRLSKLTPVGLHFASEGHTLSHMQVIPIEKLTIDNDTYRKQRELFWQLQLGTVFPNGLNSYPVNNLAFRNVTVTTATDLYILWSMFNDADNDESE